MRHPSHYHLRLPFLPQNPGHFGYNRWKLIGAIPLQIVQQIAAHCFAISCRLFLIFLFASLVVQPISLPLSRLTLLSVAVPLPECSDRAISRTLLQCADVFGYSATVCLHSSGRRFLEHHSFKLNSSSMSPSQGYLQRTYLLRLRVVTFGLLSLSLPYVVFPTSSRHLRRLPRINSFLYHYCHKMHLHELEKTPFYHAIYDADQSDIDPLWYRESLNTGYDFRLAPRNPERSRPSCRIDQDASGNYGSSGKKARQLLPVKRKREPLVPPVGDSDERAHRRPRLMTWQNGRCNGLSLPVSLKLDSPRGRELLALGMDHWPLDDQSSSAGSLESVFWSQSFASSSSSPLDDEPEPYKLRHREKDCYREQNKMNHEEYTVLSAQTIGHPAARGCIPCLRLGLPCTLLHEGATYPCQACIEDQCECDLVIQPLTKRSCEGCRRRRLRCSYLDVSSDHSEACRTCSNIGVKCVAGPASNRR